MGALYVRCVVRKVVGQLNMCGHYGARITGEGDVVYGSPRSCQGDGSGWTWLGPDQQLRYSLLCMGSNHGWMVLAN